MSVDLAVLISIGLFTPALAALLWRRGLRRGRLASALWLGFYGLVMTVMMAAHCLDILSRLYVGAGYDGKAFRYDFRTYGLMLLGAVLIACGARMMRATLGLARGDHAARPIAIRTAVLALAVVAPLIPIHAIFAIPLTATSGITLLVLLFAIRPARSRVIAIHRHDPAAQPAVA